MIEEEKCLKLTSKLLINCDVIIVIFCCKLLMVGVDDYVRVANVLEYLHVI